MSTLSLTACDPEQQRVLIIYTGGTIGMQASSAGLTTRGDIATRIAQALSTLSIKERQQLPEYDVLSYSTLIDSSAATPLNWQQLAADIHANLNRYAGFIILHGTDTLSWTASSLAYQLQGLDRPVILTGAMQPLDVANSDALENIVGALRFATQPDLQEVTVYFAGRLLRGVRSTKQHTEAADAFITPNYPQLGARVGDDCVYYKARGLAYQQQGAPRFELPDYAPLANGEVARITCWPGMAAWQLESWLADSRVKGALIQLWGAGNLGDSPALLEVLASASGEGKLLAATSQCPSGSIHLGAYAAGHGVFEAGVLSGTDMTAEAAYTKLVHLLAQPLSDKQRRTLFVTSLIGER
ncbi:asparaginase [Halomonas sp. TBZ9]|uniref:Asparaginase n=1 Tax=Vreelandella azerica TaxID=2732867 RepID=A0A7Y3XBC0_9GAMM|nr:asparaginase [Halomonas azerica]NOG32085.1 asparaginase [Halomonas azerica]